MSTHTFTVATLKGGSSRTTTAMALAAAAVSMNRRAVVADLDAQGSAQHWAQMSQAAGYPPPFPVLGVNATELPWRLAGLDADIVIIDTPPVMVDVVRAGIAVATRVVIPVHPRIGDVCRVPATVTLAREARVPVLAALTMTRPGTVAVDEAREALRSLGVPTASAMLPLREDIARSYGYGMARSLLFFGRALLEQLIKTSEDAERIRT